MQAGLMDKKLLIEQKIVTKNPDFGNEVITWGEFVVTAGWVVDILRPKEENTTAGIRLLTKPCSVMIRYRPGVTTAMRITILDRDRLLQIVSVAEIGRRKYLSLMCEEFSV
jgi:head-tail adaptor